MISPQELEAALFAGGNTLASHKNILEMLFNARVFVVLDMPWDGRSLPSTDTHVLLVSDGENLKQAMLAMFTSREKADMVPKGDSLFQYSAEVDARWALLAVPQQVGIMINPNTRPGFRILPKLTAELRKLAKQHLVTHLPAHAAEPEIGPAQ